MEFKKGSIVQYRDGGDRHIQAIVRTVHKDGTYTVEAQFSLTRDGRREGQYLGYCWRLSRDELGTPQEEGLPWPC